MDIKKLENFFNCLACIRDKLKSDIYTCVDGKTLGFENCGINLHYDDETNEYVAKVLQIAGAEIVVKSNDKEKCLRIIKRKILIHKLRCQKFGIFPPEEYLNPTFRSEFISKIFFHSLEKTKFLNINKFLDCSFIQLFAYLIFREFYLHKHWEQDFSKLPSAKYVFFETIIDIREENFKKFCNDHNVKFNVIGSAYESGEFLIRMFFPLNHDEHKNISDEFTMTYQTNNQNMVHKSFVFSCCYNGSDYDISLRVNDNNLPLFFSSVNSKYNFNPIMRDQIERDEFELFYSSRLQFIQKAINGIFYINNLYSTISRDYSMGTAGWSIGKEIFNRYSDTDSPYYIKYQAEKELQSLLLILFHEFFSNDTICYSKNKIDIINKRLENNLYKNQSMLTLENFEDLGINFDYRKGKFQFDQSIWNKLKEFLHAKKIGELIFSEPIPKNINPSQLNEFENSETLIDNSNNITNTHSHLNDIKELMNNEDIKNLLNEVILSPANYKVEDYPFGFYIKNMSKEILLDDLKNKKTKTSNRYDVESQKIVLYLCLEELASCINNHEAVFTILVIIICSLYKVDDRKAKTDQRRLIREIFSYKTIFPLCKQEEASEDKKSYTQDNEFVRWYKNILEKEIITSNINEHYSKFKKKMIKFTEENNSDLFKCIPKI